MVPSFVLSPLVRQCSLTRGYVNKAKWRCQLPSFVPAAASQIQDPAALRVLKALERIELSTPLREAPIGTVRYRLGSEQPNNANDDKLPPVLVCLHGFDSNLLEFRYFAPLVSREGYEVHCVDELGWGLTEKPLDIGYGVVERRRHLASYLRTEIGRPVTLLGASLGGAVAIDLALEYPDLVNRLVLVDAQAYTDRPASPIFESYPWLANIGAEILRSSWLRWVAVLASYRDKSFRSSDVLNIGGLHTKTDGWLNAAVDFIRREGYCLSGRVSEIDIPSLIVHGRFDRIIPKGDELRFLNDIRRAKLVHIEDGAHSPHIEKASEVAQAVLQFLEESHEAVFGEQSQVGAQA